MKKLFVIIGILFSNVSLAFTDVSESHIYKKAINYAQEENIVNGYPDNSFRPEDLVNRAEFAKIILQAAPELNINDSCEPKLSLNDIFASQWFYPFVCTLVNEDVINGYPDGTFKAEHKINMAEASKIIHLVFFDDALESHETWYIPYIVSLNSKLVIPNSITSHDHFVSRSELVEIIYRIKTKENLFYNPYFTQKMSELGKFYIETADLKIDINFEEKLREFIQNEISWSHSEAMEIYHWDNISIGIEEADVSNFDYEKAKPVLSKKTDSVYIGEPDSGSYKTLNSTDYKQFIPELRNDYSSMSSTQFRVDNLDYIIVKRDRLFNWPDSYMEIPVQLKSFEEKSLADYLLSYSTALLDIETLKFYEKTYGSSPFIVWGKAEYHNIVGYETGSLKVPFHIDTKAFTEFKNNTDISHKLIFSDLNNYNLCKSCDVSISGELRFDETGSPKAIGLFIKTEEALITLFSSIENSIEIIEEMKEVMNDIEKKYENFHGPTVDHSSSQENEALNTYTPRILTPYDEENLDSPVIPTPDYTPPTSPYEA